MEPPVFSINQSALQNNQEQGEKKTGFTYHKALSQAYHPQ
jgi:hypothetical protein